MAKGIRVNQLAKELGYQSKEILDRCKQEGLAVPNHMTVLSAGLEATLREWFPKQEGGGVATAVEAESPASRRKKKEPARAEAPAVEVQAAPAPPPAPEAPAPAAPEEPKQPEIVAAPPVRVVAEPPPVVEPPPEPPPAPAAPPPVAPAPVAVPAASPAPAGLAAAAAKGELPRPISRPTITLENRPQGTARNKTAPQMVMPQPAKIQGPRVVRQEQPETMAAPRPRRPIDAGGPPQPAFVQARAQPGRGVKSADDDLEDGDAKKKTAKGTPRTNSGRRRGVDGRRGEAMEKLKEFTDADLIERRDRLAAATTSRILFDSHLKKSSERGTHALAKTTVQKGQPVEIEEPITVKSLSAALGIKSNDIMGKLVKQGVMASINQSLDTAIAIALALEYGLELHILEQATMEEELEQEFQAATAQGERVPRPPVVTILGHVDHGKTSLLDKIRHANVAAGEAGGITQHTAAWMVDTGGKRVTFIDTPGHQAFTSMRARGANMTDVVVLVVSAAEGVQPQTIESINHARAAGVPIVVALNKIDRADANVQAVLGQFGAQELNPVEWGGTTEVVRTSATTGQGIDDLIEVLDYQSQLLELKAVEDAPARGVVIESQVDPGLGPVATVLVQGGTLKVGDVMLAGEGYGRIRSLFNDRKEPLQKATPSMPVIVSGLDQLPDAGNRFYVLDDAERARAIAELRGRVRQDQLAQQNRVTLANLVETIKAGDVKTINLIIKADVQGSAETLTKTVTDANTDEVKVKVIHSAVGAINESDVELADASNAVIIGFNVVPEDGARALSEARHVEIRLYRVIYEILDDLKKALSGLLEPEIREKLHGHAEIRQVIKVSKIGNVAGCMVTDGHIQRGSKIRLIRNGTIIVADLTLDSLRRVKDDVREVKAGLECGLKIAGYDDIKVGDVVEAYVRETFQRTL